MKGVQSLGFFFESYNKCFTSEFFFVLVKSYSISPARLQRIMEKALFLHFLITYLITLSLEKEIIVLEKVWKKSWISDPKICTNPAYVKLASHVFLHDDTPAQSSDSNQILHHFPCHSACTPV